MAFSAKPQSGIKKTLAKMMVKLMGGNAFVAFGAFQKDGAPTTNTDLANANGDLCLDYTNNDVYVASAVTASTTTWTRIINLA